MITYYDELSLEDRQEVTAVIQLLYKQTFLLERKYDKRTGRFQFNKDYRICNKHLEFIREYLAVSGIALLDDSQGGIIYIQGENVVGEKLPRLATLYILILKLIYDEQMSAASTSVNVYTTLGDLNERVGSFHLLKDRPSNTEVRRAVALLKKYQILEPLDAMDELDQNARLIIYPCVNVVLMTDDIRAMLESLRAEPAEGITETQEVYEAEEDEIEDTREADAAEEADMQEEIQEADAVEEADMQEEIQEADAVEEADRQEEIQEADAAEEPEGEEYEGTNDEDKA
ncbi:DUF4194 domain-containing protein [uncultured Robinsoniella sp.]|uniref:DUF4194 domain-containing protein n=1 Tax=uncultured Robinsoniella sp. TaxID=904190 RepID=UPI00374EFFB0